MIQKIRQYNYVNLIVMIALFLLAAFLLFGKAVASCSYTQTPESRINTELFNHHKKTE